MLTKAGMDVLVLEAGPKLDLYNDFKTHTGCVNPTITILALAMRASEYLIEQSKRGEI